MRRRLLTFATVLSLVLACAAILLWARSYWVSDAATFTRHSGPAVSSTVWSTSGYLALHRLEPAAPRTFPSNDPPPGWSYQHVPAQHNNPSRFLRSRYSHSQMGVTNHDRTWTPRDGPFANTRERAWLLPYWMPTAALLALPLVRLLTSGRRRRRASRAAAGLCAACGYDLRGHASGQRCPECGAMTNITHARELTHDEKRRLRRRKR
jgi:hypothetical protein